MLIGLIWNQFPVCETWMNVRSCNDEGSGHSTLRDEYETCLWFFNQADGSFCSVSTDTSAPPDAGFRELRSGRRTCCRDVNVKDAVRRINVTFIYHWHMLYFILNVGFFSCGFSFCVSKKKRYKIRCKINIAEIFTGQQRPLSRNHPTKHSIKTYEWIK